MEEKKAVAKKTFTEEEVKNLIQGLKSQNNQLMYQLQNLNMQNVFKRLDYLFKVVENECSFPQDFVTKCIDEIQEIMIPKDTEEPTEDEK